MIYRHVFKILRMFQNSKFCDLLGLLLVFEKLNRTPRSVSVTRKNHLKIMEKIEKNEFTIDLIFMHFCNEGSVYQVLRYLAVRIT